MADLEVYKNLSPEKGKDSKNLIETLYLILKILYLSIHL